MQIKRAVLAGNVVYTRKADAEMEADALLRSDAVESILYATAIYKTIRSTSPMRTRRREYLHVIQSTNLDGSMIYTKGKLVAVAGDDPYYILISAKRVA